MESEGIRIKNATVGGVQVVLGVRVSGRLDQQSADIRTAVPRTVDQRVVCAVWIETKIQ